MNDLGNPAPVFPQGSDAVLNRSEPQFLVVGRVLRPHGVRGELRVEIHTDYPERFAEYGHVYIGEPLTRYKIKKHRFHHDLVLLTVAGIDNRNQAESLRGQWVWIHRENAIPLQEGEYYTYQVLGLHVITDAGVELGQVAEIIETGANDVYVVQGRTGQVLLPAIPEVVVQVDIPAQKMIVHLLEGLIE